jgi:hypothetical protein
MKKKSAVSGMGIVFFGGDILHNMGQNGRNPQQRLYNTIDFHLPPKLAIFCFSSMKQQGERRRGIWSAH